jgi:hypothetical protein
MRSAAEGAFRDDVAVVQGRRNACQPLAFEIKSGRIEVVRLERPRHLAQEFLQVHIDPIALGVEHIRRRRVAR